MSTAIAEILGQYPRHQEVPGRLVLGLTGDIQSMVSGHKSEDHVIKERALIVQTIRDCGGASCNRIAEETGIAPEHVSTRLAWLQRRGIVENAHFHDIRAASATDASAAGLDSKTLLGHTTESSHRRYLRSKVVPVAQPVPARKRV